MNTKSLVRTMRFRLSLWYAASFAISFVVLGLTLYGVVRHRLITHHDGALEQAARSVERALSVDEPGQELAPSRRPEIDRTGHIVVFDVGPGGSRVLYRSTHHPANVIPDDYEFPSFPLPAQSWFATTQRPSFLIRTYSHPYRTPGGRQLLIRVYQRLGDVAAPLASLQLLLLITPVAVLVSALGGYWLAGRALGPVDQVTRMARQIEVSRLSNRLPASDVPDEIGRLVDTFNQMIARLEASFAAMKRFTADASHELKGPLTTMQGVVDVVLAQPRAAHEYRAALASVGEDVRRLRSITEDLLVLAMADAGRLALEKVAVRLDVAAAEVAASFTTAARAQRIEISTDCPAPVLVLGDERWLRQLLVNLVENAVKFTGSSASAATGSVTVSVMTANGAAALLVADSGPGIPEHALSHVFDRFYRADEARTYRGARSFGLGLSIAACIVEAHGGTITARNRPDGGTLIAAALPLAHPKVSAPIEPQPARC